MADAVKALKDVHQAVSEYFGIPLGLTALPVGLRFVEDGLGQLVEAFGLALSLIDAAVR